MYLAPQSKNWVLLAAWGCAAAAVLHIICIFAGAEWFDFLGAPPEYGQMMREGDWGFPAAVTTLISAILAIWSAYAFSTFDGRKPLPFARFVCAAVAAIFLLRGVIGITLLIYILVKTGFTLKLLFHLAASVFILAIGIGFMAAFKRLNSA